jgi:Nucleotidyl transferase AbiEii toxin, Type IV TA system
MKELHLLDSVERRLFFEVAASELKMPLEIIEKDYWVVWALGKLFSVPDVKNHLTFKGGTSLSKVFGIIHRFSEDIDLSIEKKFLGSADPEKATSGKKRRAILEKLSLACASYVQNELKDALEAAMAKSLGRPGTWQLSVDDDDPDKQTLQFQYPTTTPKGGYIRPSVKIELGARSEHWPVNDHKIQSYIKMALKDKIAEPEVVVKALNAERTFWEKATILHQYANLPEDKALPARISRHYYDFFCLLNSNVKDQTVAKQELLERVAVHKSIYFASAWANYETARKGSLKLSPPQRIVAELKRDFGLMKDMFFGPVPDWNDVLNAIEKFEADFNR